MENNTIHIFYIKQTEKLAAEIFDVFLRQMPIFFQEEILKYKFWQSAESSLLGKIILKLGFAKLNLPFTLDDIKVDAKDRPFINDAIDFNISHSGQYIICAIVENARVGIDIEKHRVLKSNIAERYFDKQECAEIDNSNQAVVTFFELWSLKESAIKCDGRGVEVLSKTHKQYEPLLSNTIICDNNLYHYKTLTIEDSYSCHVCSNERFAVELQEVNLKSLFNNIDSF